ncbi:hypothetical protein ACFWDP_41060, partial [Streptomyces anthocyanicus]
HAYHLDDAPDLKSCNLVIKSRPRNPAGPVSTSIHDSERLDNFYGRDAQLRVKYVREKKRVDYGRANESEYGFELVEGKGEE